MLPWYGSARPSQGANRAASTMISSTIAQPALTVRGSYQAAVGPNIADLSGHLMDQNQNGVNGETPQDELVTRFQITPPNSAPVLGPGPVTLTPAIFQDSFTNSGTAVDAFVATLPYSDADDPGAEETAFETRIRERAAEAGAVAGLALAEAFKRIDRL